MKKPLVSVIVPVYNVEEFLQRCLDSIKKQTYSNIEVLLVDDGSIDNSGAICDTYAKIDPRFKAFHIENGGVSRARNYALDRMKGDYCTFIDSDDIVSEFFIEHEMMSITDEKDCIVLISGFLLLHYTNADNSEQMFSKEQGEAAQICPHDYNFMSERCPLTIVGSLFCSNLIKNKRFAEELSCGEDTLFLAQILHEAKTTRVLCEDIYAYIQYPGSLSHGRYSYAKFTELIAWKKICELFSNRSSVSYISSRAAFAYRCILRIDDMVDDYKANYEYIEYAKHNARKNAFYILKSKMSVGMKVKLAVKCYLPEIQVYLCKKRHGVKDK